MRKFRNFTAICVMVTAVLMATAGAFAEPWKFGVMADTQWTPGSGTPKIYDDPAHVNSNTVSVSIANQINTQFINAGVKFVIQVGDLTDDGGDAGIMTRAVAAQPLYNANIGFYPMRGNHEYETGSVNSFGTTQLKLSFPQTQGISNTFGAINFNSPTSVSAELAGLSYSFDYNNARFVIIDPWVTPSKIDNNADGYNYGYTINDQQGWITTRLNKTTRGTDHAFVFSHQPLIAENHQDTMFSGYTNANPGWQNAFYASLQNNNVKYFISGHDHVHQRSIVASPDGNSKVQEQICASNSSKFYTPKSLTDDKWFGQKSGGTNRETSLSQETYTVGYYIYTVDGPCVTADYYSDDHGNWQSDNCYPSGGGTSQSCPGTATHGSHITPTFNFVKKETWGYCHNGKEFLVEQKSPYAIVQDSFEGTTAKILDGINNSTGKDYTSRPLTKAVNTGWVDIDRWSKTHPAHRWNPDLDLASNIFKLQGMTDLNSDRSDTYVLSLSYDHRRALPVQLGKGLLGLVSRDEKGSWVNAVDKNVGGTKKFILGPYETGYELGTYGVDPKTRTVWAVINYAGDFAAAGFRHF